MVHQLSLSDRDAGVNGAAKEFICRLMDVAGELGAPVVIGSMQGRQGPDDRDGTIARLTARLRELGERAKQYGVPLLYEPLNRYETNLFNRQGEAADWVRVHRFENVKILCDLFHMNIEESNVAAAIRRVGDLLGHVHFVDSNRRAAA